VGRRNGPARTDTQITKQSSLFIIVSSSRVPDRNKMPFRRTGGQDFNFT